MTYSKANTIAAAITIVILAVWVFILRQENMDYAKELASMKRDREEVKRVEAFIEKQAPHIPSATRRGFAEFTVETKWPLITEENK